MYSRSADDLRFVDGRAGKGRAGRQAGRHTCLIIIGLVVVYM